MIIAPSREDIRVLGNAPTYRAVAKRTNIRVSTLHRYANIESVCYVPRGAFILYPSGMIE
jgi:hypothetical protein